MNITFQREGNLLYIRPWVSWLQKPLTCRRKVGRRWSKKKKRMIPTFEDEELFSIEKDGKTNQDVCITYGGLFDKAYAEAQRMGANVHVHNLQKTLLDVAEPNWAKLNDIPELRPGQAETLASIVSAYRGHVVEPTGNGKTFIITALSYLYDNINILVVAPNVLTLSEMIERVSEMCPGEAINQLGGGRKKVKANARIAVCTNTSSHLVPSNWPHLILYDEAHTIGARKIFDKMKQFTQSVMIGLTASPTGRSDNSDLCTEALFGPVIREVEYQDAVSHGNIADIRVMMLHCDMDDIELPKDIDKERFGYWLNDARNALFVSKALEVFSFDESVIFMVSKVEHALALRRFLPNMPIAHNKIKADRWEAMGKLGLTQNYDRDEMNAVDQVQLKKDFMDGKVKWCIATHTWKQGVDTKDLAGLVRLDGFSNRILNIQIPGRLSRTGSDGQKSLGILIDSYDDYGDMYLNRSEKRVESYREKGWEIVDV